MSRNTASLSRSIVACVGLALATGCASSFPMTGGSTAPGARGVAKVSRGENGNQVIKLRVEHLAEPGAISPGATAYVVWTQSPDHAAPMQNIGQMRVDKNLEGFLETITPQSTFDLTVTPESSAQAARPTGTPVLSTRVSQDN